MKRLTGFALLAALCAAPAIANDEVPLAAGESRAPMSARDLITMPRLSSPTVTSDGRIAVYQVTVTDPETYNRSAQHYLLDLATADARPVILDLGESVSAAEFGSDDWLYFLSDRADSIGASATESDTEGYSRLWRVALEADGNATGTMLVADFDGTGIDGFKLSPDANKLAVWARLPRECPRFNCPDTEARHLPGPGDGRLYDGSDGFVRHWDHWTTPGQVNRVFVFDLANGGVVGEGVPLDGVDPQAGITGNTPTMPFGGGEDIAWSSDSQSVFFTARLSNAGEPGSTDLDIYHSDLTGAAPTELTAANPAYDSTPAPSPDGRKLAYLAMARPGYESDRTVVHLRDLATGETRALTKDFDRSFGSLAWSEDGRWIYATASDVLDTPLFRIDPRSGAVETMDLMAGHEAHIGNVTPLADDRILFTRDSIGAPHELYLSRGGRQARPLTDVAMSRMGDLATTVTTRFSFAGADGETVWGQITRLEKQEGPIPAVLYVHGGPQGSFNDGWSSRWNPRVVASQGFAVISVDFHGSVGYGQAFKDSINRDWGGKPLEDLKLGLDAALALDAQIDGSRACAMGASYGGYMMNWIAGKWPDRFNCLIQHDGLFDMRSFYYSTEELWFPRWDFGGSYSDAREEYEKWNPVNHVDNWRTPMLVITGEKDFRVPYTQGLQSFTALQERGIASQLLVFPNENHWVLGAKNSLQWHNTVFDWLDRWLDGAHTIDSNAAADE